MARFLEGLAGWSWIGLKDFIEKFFLVENLFKNNDKVEQFFGLLSFRWSLELLWADLYSLIGDVRRPVGETLGPGEFGVLSYKCSWWIDKWQKSDVITKKHIPLDLFSRSIFYDLPSGTI